MNKQYLLKGILTSLILVFAIANTNAQDYYVYRKNKVFIGIYGGVNFTMPEVIKSYSVINSDNQPGNEKAYTEFSKLKENMSNQFGFYFTYGLSNQFSLVFKPGYHTYRFNYLTSYSWTDTVEFMNTAKEFKHRQNLSYFTLPVLIRWDLAKKRFTPFIQVGGYCDILHQANKSIFTDATIDGTVDHKNNLSETANQSISKHLKTFSAGVVGGIGLSYYAKSFTIGVECNYRYGLMNIFNDRQRFADHTGFTAEYLDVMDQIKLRNIDVQLVLTFPVHPLPDLNILRRSKY